ncbi:uncharacterized protein LOC110705275 [Chenopodium quinoa]|uniref:uncharacterized protein LOC110705275 n=1 Tax=Chenopodium quinoa TaxID=63459 RepID=UPI000B76DC2A|nr:uncharacterized protein LOC110705275 [Chenopodium quinoa]
MAWNCRGLGQADSPKVPYIASLVRSCGVDVIFLAETMVSVNSVMHKLSSLSCSGFVGMDSVGLSGGICVLWFAPVLIDPLLVFSHIILCRVVENLVIKYVLFLYGAPQVSDRMTVWSKISDILASYQNIVLVGDFNQVEYLSDKAEGNLDIPGRHDFIQWKLDNGLLDIPFSRPSFTWTNGRTVMDPTFERLDKAYATSHWLQDWLATSVHHQPILFSDHAAIILSDSLPSDRYKRPYRIENWCLHSEDVANMVQTTFVEHIPGSLMFSLSKRLCVLRHRLLAWCVSHKKAWGIDWKALVADVTNAFFNLDSRNSRCLFIQARRRKNTIMGLKDNEGSWVSDTGDIRSLVLSFYKSLYSRNLDRPSAEFPWDSLQLPSLFDRHRQSMLTPFSADDIKQAMFSIADDKSPGPDGYTSAFFKTYWSEVGDQVVNVVQLFFAHGYLLKDWNRTFLVLLPKVDHPELVSQFRSIGLCNVLYKCISKCLARRLRWILPDIVLDFHNAFVPGRLISDNCLMVHEILSFMNASKARKRFYAALKLDMNKAYDRVEWDFLCRCVSTVSYQVLVNGSPTEVFRPQRGLRQGDPLFPYLFVLCMEVSPPACEEVLNVLSAFCDISGQMLNLQKSFVKFSPNTPEDYRSYMSGCLKMRSESRLGSYLGLPVDLGRSKCSEFGFLLDKVAKRLQDFTALRLSPAAKLVIINSVLIASFNHILSVSKIPESICSRMDNLLARFWWKSSSSNRGLALRSSLLLHLPKGLGGLGIRSISPFNSSMLAKQSWRLIHCPQLLVSRLLSAKYPTLCSTNSFSTSRPSWGCRGLISGMSLLSKGLCWKYATIIHGLFDSSSAARILSLDRPVRLMDDFVYWKFTRDGVFTTKSSYALLCEPRVMSGSPSQISQAWWRKFWALPILPRWKIFGWKLVHDALPLATILNSRGLTNDPVCEFFHADVKSVSHTFRDCPAICSLWLYRALGIQWDLMQFPSFSIWFSDWVIRNMQALDWKRFTRSSRSVSLEARHDVKWLCLRGLPYISPTACLMVDGDWDCSTYRAGAGLIVRDLHSSEVLGGGCRAFMASSAWQSEIQACIWGLEYAIRKGFLKIRVYTDCAALLTLLPPSGLMEISAWWLIQELWACVQSLLVCQVQKVPRMWDTPAHWLAGCARRRQLLYFLF